MIISETALDKEYTIKGLHDNLTEGVAKLTAMGILPGVTLKLIQKKPLPVIQIGYTRFALDNELFELIDVN